jgi:hypothetical protein
MPPEPAEGGIEGGACRRLMMAAPAHMFTIARVAQIFGEASS